MTGKSKDIFVVLNAFFDVKHGKYRTNVYSLVFRQVTTSLGVLEASTN